MVLFVLPGSVCAEVDTLHIVLQVALILCLMPVSNAYSPSVFSTGAVLCKQWS